MNDGSNRGGQVPDVPEASGQPEPGLPSGPMADAGVSAQVETPHVSGAKKIRQWFHAEPVWKLVVFGLAGSSIYIFFWMYRNWSAYRHASGYSRRPFWRQVKRTTGYEPSPFWRSVFGVTYCFCLFPAVDRECRRNGVEGVVAPIALAIAYDVVMPLIWAAVAGPIRLPRLDVLALVPVQLAINRLNCHAGRPARFRVQGIELVAVAVGAWLQWR
jgi:hypothetical protein